MAILLCVIATVIAIILTILVISSDDKMYMEMLSTLIHMQKYDLDEINAEKAAYIRKVSQNNKDALKSRGVKAKIKSFDKKIQSHQKQIDLFKNNRLSVLDMLALPGYALIPKLKLDADNQLFKTIIKMYSQLGDKRYALSNANYIVANMLAMIIFGAASAVMLGVFSVTVENGSRIAVIAVAVFFGIALMGYVPFSRLRDRTNKRTADIERDFANCVSKMALLVGAGMEVPKAWELTSSSGDAVLFVEMRRVSDELNNNISPNAAYNNFINRCNTKFTTKLATAIMQNLTKGNSEIAVLFKQIADESWAEKKHKARRIGENMSGTLLIPTLMTFAGIIVLVIVPIFMSMNSNMIG